MADYRFSKEKYRQLCYWTRHGKLFEIKALIKEVQPKERVLFGPTTFCPPLKYMLKTPLVIACYWGKFHIVKYFLETFPNIIDVDTLAVIFFNKKTAITPLIAACMAECRDGRDQASQKIIQYLISKGAKINKLSTDGSTPLHHALSLETIKYLLECGADINKTCNEGNSLLVKVAGSFVLKKEAQIEILRYLLDNNANVYQCAKNGYTALHMASHSSFACEEVLKLLLDSGAPPMFTATSCVTDIDYIPSPVYLVAVSTGNEAIVNVFLQREDCPIECIVDVYLLIAMRSLSLAMYFFQGEEEKIRFYHVWIKGLEIMKEYNVQLSYPLPVDEYDLREEVKTKEELDAIWGNTLEILFQYVLLYERCLGRVCIHYLLEVGNRMIDNGYLNEGESVIKRSVLLQTNICEKICSKPPNYYPFPRFHVTQSVQDELHVLVRKFLQTGYPPNFQLYIKFGLTALKTKYHLQLQVERDDKRQVLLLFSMWMKSCDFFTNSSYPFELISLAKEFVLSFRYYPEGSELLLSNSDFIYQYPSLLRLLLEVGGDAVINDVGWDGRTLLQVALKKAVNAYKVERIEEVIKILLEYGAHVDTTNSKGLTLFSDLVKSKLPSYKALCFPHLPLSLYCIAANAVAKYCIPYQGLPSHVIDFIKLHDPQYFKQLDYFL